MFTENSNGGRARCGIAATVAVAVLITVLTASCTASSPSSGRATGGTVVTQDDGVPVDGGAIVFGVPGETTGWNPHDDTWPGWSALVATSMMEPLATLDRDLNPVPWLAVSWTPNATYDSYTVKLRANVTFHNGEPFDAAAVKLNLDDAMTATLTSISLKGLFEAITVVDPLTVQVDLAQPWAAFPNTFLAGTTNLIMAPAMLKSPDRGKSHPIGTGPFVFASWERDRTFKTTKNPRYWQAGKPHVDALDFSVIGDAGTQSAALRAGDIDMVMTSSYDVATRDAEGYSVIKDWTASPGMALANTAPEIGGSPNPLANLHARRALAHATDQQALADAVGEGIRLPRSPISSTGKWSLPDDQTGYPTFDPAKAKEELVRYQEETGASSLTVELSSVSDTDTLRVAQALQAQWRDAGIDASISSKEAGAFVTDVVFGKYQLALFGMYGAPDPDFNYYFWTADNIHPAGQISLNFSRFTTPKMEAALHTGRANPDFATRKQAYDDIVREINTNAVHIWTYYFPNSIVADPSIRGLQTPTEVPFHGSPPVWLADLWLSA